MMLRSLLLAMLLIAPALAQSDAEQALLAERRVWWRTADHALDIAPLAPLETVRGRATAPLPSGPSDIDPAAVAKALAYVQRGRTQSFLVWHAGALRFEYYGPGFGPGSRASPASLPKPMLALAAGAAVARGKLALDAPVARWLPEWRGDPRGAITLRQLLQMRSGLAKDGATGQGGRAEQLMIGTRFADVLLATSAAGPPGALFNYSNTDNELVALLVERATGMRYADWLSRTIWQPLGAADASVWLDRPGGLARTYCCLLATARDWIRVGRLIKDGGRAADGRRVLPASWIDAMIAPSPANPNYGFQIWRASPYAPLRNYGPGTQPVPASAPFVADDMVFFDGAVGQRVYISRSRDLVIVRIGTSIPDWDDSILPNLIVAGLR